MCYGSDERGCQSARFCCHLRLALAAKEVREAELHAKIQKLQEEWDATGLFEQGAASKHGH